MKNHLWASLGGGLLALTLLTGSASPVRAQAVNLATTATASSSSDWEDGTDFAAKKANDNDPTTRWNSRSGDANDSWLALTWSSPVTFNKVAVDEDFNRVRAYRLEVPDGANWKTIYDSTGTNIDPSNSSTPTYTVILPQPVTTTALRFYVIDTTAVPSIFEFRVYNAQLGTVTGTVTDANGAPVAGATVSAGGATATADAQGKYTLTVESGLQTITANKAGAFRSHSAFDVNITAGGTATQNFSLLPLPTDLALTATADASTSYHFDSGTTDYVAAKINDGDLSTRWNSDDGDIQGSWVSLTWTAAQTFNTIIVRENLGRIMDYTIQTFDTTKNDWVDVKQYTLDATNKDRVLTTVLPTAITTKQLRILINDASGLPTIFEVQVTNDPLGTVSGTVVDTTTGKPVTGAIVHLDPYGDIATTDATGTFTAQIAPDDYRLSAGGATGYFDSTSQIISVFPGQTTGNLKISLPATGDNLALKGTASASFEDANPASNANDGDPATSWSTDSSNTTNQWVAVTFAQATTFNVVNLVGFVGTIQKSNLQYLAADGTTWTDIPNTTINPETLAVQGKPAILVFDPITSKGVRFFIDYTNSQTGVPGLSELEVYSSPIGGSTVLKGDLNGDGKVNIADATMALQFAVGNGTPTADQITAGDVVGGDGKIGIPDVTKILQAAIGAIQL